VNVAASERRSILLSTGRELTALREALLVRLGGYLTPARRLESFSELKNLTWLEAALQARISTESSSPADSKPLDETAVQVRPAQGSSVCSYVLSYSSQDARRILSACCRLLEACLADAVGLPQLLREAAMEQLRRLRVLLTVTETSGTQEATASTGFKFVKSALIDAMRTGKWVLLDSINCASQVCARAGAACGPPTCNARPQDVIERLNSLFEDNPELIVYEADGEVFRRPGPRNAKSSAEHNFTPIHENFRLFCTANTGRIHSQKLSTALMNRCVRLALPAIDWEVESLVVTNWAAHEIHQLCRHGLNGVVGGEEFAVRHTRSAPCVLTRARHRAGSGYLLPRPRQAAHCQRGGICARGISNHLPLRGARSLCRSSPGVCRGSLPAVPCTHAPDV
jgi:hypothetical protein